MPKGKKRDIYRGRHEEGFDINRDVDLAHLRAIMGMPEPSNEDYNFFGLYVENIIKIMLNGAKFRGYPDDVKEDLAGEARIDMLKARRKFKGDLFPARTAPFNYLFRIGFHSFQHVLANYYEMQHRMVSASRVGAGTRLMDSPVEFSDDIIEKAVNDWELIEENLRD